MCLLEGAQDAGSTPATSTNFLVIILTPSRFLIIFWREGVFSGVQP